MTTPQTDALESVIIETRQPADTCLIWLHGLGADGNDFVPLVEQLSVSQSQKLRYVFPHAPIRPVTINARMPMRAWYDICSLTQIQQEDGAGIQEATQLINTLIDQQLEQIAPSRIVLGGFSQGGAMALYAGVRLTRKIAGIVALSAYLPLAHSLNASAISANQNTPIFLGHGVQDAVVPVQASYHAQHRFAALGMKVSMQTYPMGHEVCLQEISDLDAWLETIYIDF